jgi:hypothetical protein
MKYQVQIKYTNPSHEHVSLRRRVESVTRLVEAANEQEAINRATKQQRALGFNITEAEVYMPVNGLHSLALNNNEPQKGKEKKKELVGKDGEKTDIAASGGVKKEEKGGTESYPLLKKGEKLKPMKIGEGFDTDPKDIAAYLVDRHGKGKVTMDHIEAYERRRDSHRPIEKHEVMKHVKKMSEEVEELDEAQKKLKPSYWRAEWRLGTKSEVDKNNKKIYDRLVKTDPEKAAKFHDNLMKMRKEEVEAVEEGAKDWKKAFSSVAKKNLQKDIGSVRSKVARMDYIGLEPKVAERPVTARDKNRKELGEEVVSEAMPAYVKKGQEKFDAQARAQRATEKADKAQAGTLVAQKSRKAAERMVNRAKGNANKIDVAPTIEPGKPNLQR